MVTLRHPLEVSFFHINQNGETFTILSHHAEAVGSFTPSHRAGQLSLLQPVPATPMGSLHLLWYQTVGSMMFNQSTVKDDCDAVHTAHKPLVPDHIVGAVVRGFIETEDGEVG